MNKILLSVVLFVASAFAVAADGPRMPGSAPTAAALPSSAAAGATVYFIEPADGATVPQKFTVKFGVKGVSILPAGTDEPNSGHHHLLVDLTVMPDMTRPLPSNDHILHFGKGQTETKLSLPPGTHTLQLVLGDYQHIPHSPPVMSKRITITVE